MALVDHSTSHVLLHYCRRDLRHHTDSTGMCAEGGGGGGGAEEPTAGKTSTHLHLLGMSFTFSLFQASLSVGARRFMFGSLPLQSCIHIYIYIYFFFFFFFLLQYSTYPVAETVQRKAAQLASKGSRSKQRWW